MILVGQLNSPFVRRTAVALRILGLDYRAEPLSVFGDAEAMRRINPLGRVPSLILDDGEILVNSAAILDWLDELVGPERALLPRAGAERRRQLQLVALASGCAEKVTVAAYERMVRPPDKLWPYWLERAQQQATSGLVALEARLGAALDHAHGRSWLGGERLGLADIMVACLLDYIEIAAPELVAPGRYPALEAHGAACQQLSAFAETRPAAYVIPARL